MGDESEGDLGGGVEERDNCNRKEGWEVARLKAHAKELESSFVSNGEIEGLGDNERSSSY